MPVPGLEHGDFVIYGLPNDVPSNAWAQDKIWLTTFGLEGATLQAGEPTTREFMVPMQLWRASDVWTFDEREAFYETLVDRAGTIATLKFYNPSATLTRTIQRCELGQVQRLLDRYDSTHGYWMDVVLPFVQIRGT